MPRGEQIAKPAERETRLAGSLLWSLTPGGDHVQRPRTPPRASSVVRQPPSLTTQAPPSQRADPYRLVLGTWELNVAKSVDPPKSQTRTYEMTGPNLKLTDHIVDTDGHETVVVWSGRYDGKDYPVIGSAAFDAQAITASDAYRAAYTIKKAGKVVGHGTRVVSPDGKMLTVSGKFTTPEGQDVNFLGVFDKR